MRKIFYASILFWIAFIGIGKISAQNIASEVVSNLNTAALVSQAEEWDKQGEMTMNATWVNFTLDMVNEGQWEYSTDGSKRWVYAFKSPGALAMSLVFDHYYMPEGCELYFFAKDKSWIEGPFTSKQNKSHHIYRTPEAFGDEAVIEYREPAGVTSQPKLQLRGILHFYRLVDDLRWSSEESREVNSDPCEVDVNCPEGDLWEKEKHAIVRLSLASSQGGGLCSGTLVNNSNLDCKNYILTAMHCTEMSSDANLLASSARFNFKRSNCGSGLGPTSQQLTGLFLKADSNDGGGATGSDYALLEIEDPIPSTWTIYYAGWDASDALPGSMANGAKVVCLHHPSGDYMKISHASSCIKGTWQSNDKHWRTVWMATETNHGVTEGGSSGSPIFNDKHQIIGTLTGGGSFCTSPTSPDYYGRMAKHWSATANPNANGQELSVWLDPAGTNALFLNGSYPHVDKVLPCDPASIDEELLQFNDVVVYPTLINESFTVELKNNQSINQCMVFDANGKLLEDRKTDRNSLLFDTTQWANGVYYLTVKHRNGSFVTKKIVVAHS